MTELLHFLALTKSKSFLVTSLEATAIPMQRAYWFHDGVGLDPTKDAISAGNHDMGSGRSKGGAERNIGDIGNFWDDVCDSREPSLFCIDIASISLCLSRTISNILFVGKVLLSTGSLTLYERIDPPCVGWPFEYYCHAS